MNLDLTEVGRTGKAHGAEGELRLHVEEKYLEPMLRGGHIFILTEGQPVPYFFENVRGDMLDIVKLEEIDTPEDARPLTDQPAFLLTESVAAFQTADTPEGPYAHLTGYTLHDRTSGYEAEILRIEEFPEQWMAVVKRDGREVYIPLGEGIIQSTDSDQKIVEVELADGIWDL